MTPFEQRNISAMLATIKDAEGTSKYANPYATLFGGRQLGDLSKHPEIKQNFKQTDGKIEQTSAAGAYQFIGSTYEGVAKKLGLKDFSPASQDLAAVELIRQRGALDDVKAGRFDIAIAKLGKEWASLPSSTAKQNTRSNDFISKSLSKHLGEPVSVAGTAPKNSTPNNAEADYAKMMQFNSSDIQPIASAPEDLNMALIDGIFNGTGDAPKTGDQMFKELMAQAIVETDPYAGMRQKAGEIWDNTEVAQQGYANV